MTPELSLIATLGLGFALGLRHALDLDHVAAVSTLVARERDLWRSTRIGAVWGLGHTATLLVMGLIIIAFGLQIPDAWAAKLHLAVAAMLIFLGARTLWSWWRGSGHFCTHQYGEHAHTHFHRHGKHSCAQTDETSPPKSGAASVRNSFAVGMIHGLSGSAELMLLVLATIRHPLWALAYIALFGAGMMSAMLVLTTLFSWVLQATSHLQGGWQRFDTGVRALTGVASLGLGIYLMYQSVAA